MIIKEKAYAKLNLSLDVLGKREDGYHNMCMLMQTVSLCDELEITETDGAAVRALSSLPYIPGDERNLAVKAAKVYLRASGREGMGLDIRIKKHIPVGAGMAGGSTDAAAVLRALNRHDGGRFTARELEALAAEVGSDVAFCVAGGTALASGRGELLTPVSPMPDCGIVIVKPGFSVSTPELFRRLDTVQLRAHPDTAGMLRALDAGDLRELCLRMYNVFEDCGDRRMREVGRIKGKLLDHGALGALMTGTGSAVFGVFPDELSAEAARRELSREHRFVCTARPVKKIL